MNYHIQQVSYFGIANIYQGNEPRFSHFYEHNGYPDDH